MTDGSTSTLRWEIDDRVATVWLHRPHRHNAWTGTMHTVVICTSPAPRLMQRHVYPEKQKAAAP